MRALFLWSLYMTHFLKVFLIFSLLFAGVLEASDRVLVVRLKGEVTLDGRQLEVGDAIKIGSKVIANGKKSFVQFQFASGSLLMLKDGEMVINKVVAKRTVVDLVRGTIFSFIKKKDGRKFKIRTKNAALGIRSTKFYVQAVPDDTYLCVCDGTVNIKNKKGSMDIGAEEDIHVSLDGELKKAKANKMMWEMTQEGFKEMGFDIPPLTKNEE